jgi:hypothetical protein
MAAMIRLQFSGRSRDTGGRKTDSLTYPYNKKQPHGVSSGDLGGQRSIAWSSATVAAFSFNLFPWRPSTKLSVLGKYKRIWRTSLSICGSRVDALAAIYYIDFVKYFRGL